MSSRSPACMMVLTSASMPPIWHTVTLFLVLLHVKFERIPAAHVTVFKSFDANSCTSEFSRFSRLSCIQHKVKDIHTCVVMFVVISRLRFIQQTSKHLAITHELTHLVAASDKFLSAHRQLPTRRWLACIRCMASACMPPAANNTQPSPFYLDIILNMNKSQEWLRSTTNYDRILL